MHSGEAAGEAVSTETARTIQSVSRALELLALFTPQRSRWSVSDLARTTGLHKSVVTRLMATMNLAGFVVQDPASKTYGIGPRAFAVGNVYEPHTILSQIARPVMHEVTEQHGHATSLGVPAGAAFVYLLVNERVHPMRVAAAVGEVRDYHANAIGKVLLAGRRDDEVRALLGSAPLPRPTRYTIASIDRLLAELVEVRRSGVAFNREEAVMGIGAVASPVVDGVGTHIAGLSIVYPSHLVTVQEVDRLAEAVKAAARAISLQLSR